MALLWHFLSKKGDKMLLVRSEDDYKNKSYVESALHFSHTRGGIGRRSTG